MRRKIRLMMDGGRIIADPNIAFSMLMQAVMANIAVLSTGVAIGVWMGRRK